MVMMCQPLYDAVTAVEASDPRPATRILLTPQGAPLTQAMVEGFARRPRLLLIAGHYEGIDERVIEELAPVEVSIGDFVLSGGEIPALALIDAVVRRCRGRSGDQSAAEDSFMPTGERAAPVDCPHTPAPGVEGARGPGG